MSQTWLLIGFFVLLLSLLPWGLKWLQRRVTGGLSGAALTRIVSAVAVGPQQRVVTVEVGPEGARTWLTLGVTAQTITCLHTAAVRPAAAPTAITAMTDPSVPASGDL